MNFRGYAGYVDYLTKIETKQNTIDEETNNYFSSSSSEEENPTSNSFEVIEKIDFQKVFDFSLLSSSSSTQQEEYYHLDLFSLLKISIKTPPPELV
ncbi:hypothetical protein [Faecalibacter rhinopitheci]|uniref:Uncharacterized protein n=1 Tax=Faecalibacter rhinopitheci TaxID=2779678 RepID=A0A8J7FTS9_9FLAO|nr:hypothetical protein [Faecalibacter rhinopitheci]MBF0596276.1 hypothetical protein [Faecalibacter rhinopitheci]MBQ0148573.1 hypothetical protein [Candidatus Onthonaster equi]